MAPIAVGDPLEADVLVGLIPVVCAVERDGVMVMFGSDGNEEFVSAGGGPDAPTVSPDDPNGLFFSPTPRPTPIATGTAMSDNIIARTVKRYFVLDTVPPS